MPSLEYSKRGLFIKGLDVALTANYNKNATTNIDTASYKYNWLGDRKLMNSPGEQSNQYSRADNNNWNGTLTVNYRLAKIHMLTFNHVLNTFRRSNTSLLAKMESEDAIAKDKSFRRLKHKTQVFLQPEGDHYRPRLTHTLEVARIARTISRALMLNEDLTEAIALGHDLGHTPFGHAGERALNDIFPGGFRHYEQSLRVVDRLEKDGRGTFQSENHETPCAYRLLR